MDRDLVINQLTDAGLSAIDATTMAARLIPLLEGENEALVWQTVTEDLLTPDVPFDVHRLLFEVIYAGWDETRGPAPAWLPAQDAVAHSNLGRLMKTVGAADYAALYDWSIRDRILFRQIVLKVLNCHMN